MLIVCPDCATSYQVEPNSLRPGGRSVRCARCQNVWFATAPTVVPAMTAVQDWDIIDTGPRVPSVDSPPAAEPAPAEITAPPDEIPEIAAAPEILLAEIPDDSPATPGSAEGIDLAGLSSEMTAEHAEQAAEADAVLAEVEAGEIVATDSPPLVPSPQPLVAATAAGEDIETFAARRARHNALRRRRWLAPGLPAAILALAAANVSMIVWRADIVRLLPQTASLYAAVGLPVNLRGLAFDNIQMSRAEHDGVGVLVVEGSIVNVSGRPVEVPRLRLAVRNGGKNEIYAWTALPARSILGPGETLPFRSRLASPPAEAREVMVRFFSRRDVVAGLN
jgi:predicted Zn finger-like uncharacterized protein